MPSFSCHRIALYLWWTIFTHSNTCRCRNVIQQQMEMQMEIYQWKCNRKAKHRTHTYIICIHVSTGNGLVYSNGEPLLNRNQFTIKPKSRNYFLWQFLWPSQRDSIHLFLRQSCMWMVMVWREGALVQPDCQLMYWLFCSIWAWLELSLVNSIFVSLAQKTKKYEMKYVFTYTYGVIAGILLCVVLLCPTERNFYQNGPSNRKDIFYLYKNW